MGGDSQGPRTTPRKPHQPHKTGGVGKIRRTEGTENVKRDTYTADGNILRPTFQHAGWRQEQVSEITRLQPRLIGGAEAPSAALSWQGRSQRTKILDDWRIEVGKVFPASALVLRVAWTLEAAFGSNKGYARITDRYLARKLGVTLNSIRSSLTKLDRAGLIVRAIVDVDGKRLRRIWPARAIARPASGILPVSGQRS